MTQYTIKNFEKLATTPLRHDALTIAEAGFSAINTPAAIRDQVRVEDGVLTVGDQRFVLSDYRYVYIIGFGKVSCTAAAVLEQILAGKVHAGAAVGIKQTTCSVVDTYAGTHPLPSHLNYTATRHIEEIARGATADDLVIVVVSGGGSALLCSTLGECEQGHHLYTTFLQSGGTIDELNTVRKHISSLKGGGLAKALYPATVVSLVFSDVPGGDLSSVASGPTYKDETTVADAAAIIEKYHLGSFHLTETPKEDKYFERVHNLPLVSNITALDAMKQKAVELGYTARVLASTHYATPEETIALFSEAAEPGTVLLAGGETVLSIPDGCIGKGGRNDFLALATLPHLLASQVFVSFASDGKDNTEAAGALADKNIALTAHSANIKPTDYIECLNSYPFFEATGGHIVTGILESNVSDLMLLLTASEGNINH